MSVNETAQKLIEQLNTKLTFSRLDGLFECCRVMQSEGNQDCQNTNMRFVRGWAELGAADQEKSFESRKKYYELVRKSLLFSAADDLDSYLQYMEIDREPEKRFYLPRRKVFLPIVRDVQALMDDKLDLLTYSMPPGAGKTTFGTFVLSWVMGKWPDKPNLSSGHSDKMTRSIFDGVQSLIVDPDYKFSEIFPGVSIVAENSKDETIDLVKKKRFPTLTSRSIDGSLTGATRCERLLYIDDLVSGIEEALSPSRLDTLWQKYTNDLKSRKKTGCKELHVATRWSVHDPIGRLQSQYYDNTRAKFVALPALDENDESNFHYPYGVGFDTEYFHDMRDSLDDVSWRCLFMNDPIEREGLLFHPDELNYYNGELPGETPCRILAHNDVAWGGGDSLSMPFGYEYDDGRVFIPDVVFSGADKDVTRPICAGRLISNNVQWAEFEANNGGDEYAEDISEAVKKVGRSINITSKRAPSDKSKLARITQYAPDIKRFYFLERKKRSQEYQAFMEELTAFTQTGKVKHDDAPDSLAGLASMIVGREEKPVVKVLRRTF